MLCFRLLYPIVLTSDVYDACVRACVHWHCSAQLSMFNMEKCYRNKIIIIIIINNKDQSWSACRGFSLSCCRCPWASFWALVVSWHHCCHCCNYGDCCSSHCCFTSGVSAAYGLVGLVVKASASRAEDPGFESRLRRDFFGVESYR